MSLPAKRSNSRKHLSRSDSRGEHYRLLYQLSYLGDVIDSNIRPKNLLNRSPRAISRSFDCSRPAESQSRVYRRLPPDRSARAVFLLPITLSHVSPNGQSLAPLHPRNLFRCVLN
jgi:hypothetical protein